MKKRIYIALYISVMFIMSTYISGYAEGMNTYTINELALSITIPDNYAVVTRDIHENDPNLAAFARTKDDMLSFMTAKNIYLDAFDKNANNEIVITKTDNDLMDFNNISDDILLEFIEEMKSEYETVGATYMKSGMYDNGKMKFIKIYISQPNANNTVYGLQYYTVYNNKAINITIHSYTSQITDEIETEIKNIVDSADFNVGVKTSDTGYSHVEDSGMSILFGLILTIIIYSLPIIIYRYVIRREPVKPSTAKKITIIYGIAALIVMSVILFSLGGAPRGAIILWSYFNYRILTKGYVDEKEYLPDTESIENEEECIEINEIRLNHICTECSAKFKIRYDIPDTQNEIPNLKVICPKCGTEQIISSNDIIKNILDEEAE